MPKASVVLVYAAWSALFKLRNDHIKAFKSTTLAWLSSLSLAKHVLVLISVGTCDCASVIIITLLITTLNYTTNSHRLN